MSLSRLKQAEHKNLHRVSQVIAPKVLYRERHFSQSILFLDVNKVDP